MVTVSLRSFAFLFINFISWALYSFSSLAFSFSLIFNNFLWYSDLSMTFLTIYSSNSSSILEYSSSNSSSFCLSYLILFPLRLLEEGLKKDVPVSLIIERLKGLMMQLEDMLMLVLLIWLCYDFSAFEIILSFSLEMGNKMSIFLTYSS